MEVYIPLTITPAMLTASTIPEVDTSVGEAFIFGAQPAIINDVVINNTTKEKYLSLAGGPRATVTFSGVTAGQPWQVNWPSHGLSPGGQVVFGTTGQLPNAQAWNPNPGYSLFPNQTYNVATVVDANTFTMTGSVYPGAGNFTQSGVHNGTKNPNGGGFPVSPATENAYWRALGKSNRWKVFDTFGQTQSQRSTSAEWTIQLEAGQTANRLAIVNMAGVSSVRVRVYNGATLVQDQTKNTAGSTIPTWADYFYFITDSYDSVYFDNLAAIAGGTIIITFNGASTVYVGELFLGYGLSIGAAQYGARAGITDYSVKATNALGGTYLNQRSYAKNVTTTLFLTKEETDRVARLLIKYRATAALWVLSPDQDYLGLGLIYGWYNDFNVEIAYPKHNLCSLEIKGLT